MVPLAQRATRRSALPRGLVCLILGAVATGVAGAQTHRVEANQDVTRAIGVYEWTGDVAKPAGARLVPVSIFIDGKFHDAGTYLSQPVPLALQSGNQYVLETAGLPTGLLNLDFSRRTAAVAGDSFADAGWLGFGTYAPYREPAPKQLASVDVKLHSSADDSEGPPSIKRPRNEPENQKDAKGQSQTPTKSQSRTDAAETPPADADRPTLRKRGSAPDSSGKVGTANANVTPVTGSLNDDPDRPHLERGRPSDAQAASQLKGLPKDLHQSVAVSDAANRDPHVFTRAWESPREQADVTAKMEAIAEPLAMKYAQTALHVGAQPPATDQRPVLHRTAPHAVTPKRAVRGLVTGSVAAAPKSSALSLTDTALQGFTLSYGGLPVFVYSARVAAAEGSAGRPELYITVVAEQLPSGQLQPALTSITDASHLDQTPRLRFVDAVDTDWEHRGSLLFELRGQSSRQFALYRVLSAHATQYFITEPVS